MADGEQVIDHFEALVACRVVHGGDVYDAGELGSGVVFQEGECGENTVGRDVDSELIFPDRESVTSRSACGFSRTLGCIRNVLLDVLGQTREQVLAVLVKRLCLVLYFV